MILQNLTNSFRSTRYIWCGYILKLDITLTLAVGLNRPTRILNEMVRITILLQS